MDNRRTSSLARAERPGWRGWVGDRPEGDLGDLEPLLPPLEAIPGEGYEQGTGECPLHIWNTDAENTVNDDPIRSKGNFRRSFL